MPCKSTSILLHQFTSSPLAPEEKTPKPCQTRERNPSKRTVLHQRSVPFESEFSLNPFLALICNHMVLPLTVFSSLDLLPKEIFGTGEVPEYILSDSSEEGENATPAQRANHQLRHRIRHLKHNLRDITARCNAERERCMSLEALVGGKTYIFI
jgi:hypothetical protein